jgi:hypothetical protein
MKKVLITIIIGILLISIGGIYFLNKNNPNFPIKIPGLDSKYFIKNNQDSKNENIETSNSTPTSQTSGSEGGGGESSSGGGRSTTNLEEEIIVYNKDIKTTCSLVRPGNIPNIECSVNHIKPNEVSLNINNEFGQEIGIEISLDSCSPTIEDTIANNNEKDFIFSCNNKEFFTRELSITYNLENTTITVGGFVAGPITL